VAHSHTFTGRRHLFGLTKNALLVNGFALHKKRVIHTLAPAIKAGIDSLPAGVKMVLNSCESAAPNTD
jgi:hypothetical protein